MSGDSIIRHRKNKCDVEVQQMELAESFWLDRLLLAHLSITTATPYQYSVGLVLKRKSPMLHPASDLLLEELPFFGDSSIPQNC